MRLPYLPSVVLAFLTLCATGYLAAQEEPAPLPQGWTRLEPFKEGLVAIDFPDLGNAEPVVRDQILRFRNSLISLTKNVPDANMELSNAYGLLGNVCFAYQMRSTAESCYINAVRLQPEQFRWNYILGMLNMEQGDAEEAIGFLKKAAVGKADYGPLWTNLGDLEMQFNRTEEARKYYQHSLEINPKSAAAMFGMGQLAMFEDKPADAVAWFEKVLNLVPQANRVHYSLGTAWRKLGDIEKARTHLNLSGKVGVREDDPLMEDIQSYLRGERVHMIRGKTAFNAGRYQEAAEEYSKAVKSKPNSVRALSNLGSTLGMLGRFQEALDRFEQVLALEPKNENVHFNMGQIYNSMGLWQQAATHLNRAVLAAPGDLLARMGLVKALTGLGSYLDALSHLERIAEAGPLPEEGVLQQAQLLILTNDQLRARDVLAEASARLPESGSIAHMRARFLASCPDLSLRDGKTALELALLVLRASSTTDHAVTLAMAYAEVGECDEAARLQEQVVAALSEQEDPENVSRMKEMLEHFRSSRPCRVK